MMPLAVVDHQAPVLPPSYQRAQARLAPALHVDALTLVTILHLLTLCRLAVRLAQRRCPPPLPAGPGGTPRTYTEESLLLIALLRTLWHLSYQDMCDWLKSWPALALACAACRWIKMDTCAFPVHPNSAIVVMQLEPLCTSRSSCSRLCKPCDDGSFRCHYQIRPRVVRLDAAYWGAAPHRLDSHSPGCDCGHSLEFQTPEEPFLLATNLDQRGIGQA